MKPSQIKSLERLYARRYPSLGGYSLDQARELAALSRSISRQVAVFLDRQGRVDMVLVGDAGGITIPELRGRPGGARLRGLRLIHTHLSKEPLSQEDLMDLLFLRLDSLGVLDVDEFGLPRTFSLAHLAPGSAAGKPYRVFEPMAWDKVEVDFAALSADLEDELARNQGLTHAENGKERAILVSVSTAPRQVQESRLAELAELARTAGLQVVGTLVQRVAEVNLKFLLGRGKAADLEVLALRENAGVIIFDGELSPSQLNSLAAITERKVLDRTQVILDIFAQRAATRAGRLQVELAQLKYALPRLAGSAAGRAMDRLAGGIGGRGPGETKLETDRRKIRERITRLAGRLDSIRRQRSFVRARRAKARLPVASLVGYTNSGKSTLLNTLTQSAVLAEDKLFATLDPTSRRLRVPEERELILVDTVGFIRDLPKELKEAFQATLEELAVADLLVHVADAGHPELAEQLASVQEILRGLELQDIPCLLVLNKWDAVDEEAAALLRKTYPEALPVSALTGLGLAALSEEIARRIDWEVNYIAEVTEPVSIIQ